jgi:hypothetical protein
MLCHNAGDRLLKLIKPPIRDESTDTPSNRIAGMHSQVIVT